MGAVLVAIGVPLLIVLVLMVVGGFMPPEGIVLRIMPPEKPLWKRKKRP